MTPGGYMGILGIWACKSPTTSVPTTSPDSTCSIILKRQFSESPKQLLRFFFPYLRREKQTKHTIYDPVLCVQTCGWLLSAWKHVWGGLYPMWAQDMESYDLHPNPILLQSPKSWGMWLKLHEEDLGTKSPPAHSPIHFCKSTHYKRQNGMSSGKTGDFFKAYCQEKHLPPAYPWAIPGLSHPMPSNKRNQNQAWLWRQVLAYYTNDLSCYCRFVKLILVNRNGSYLFTIIRNAWN